MSKPQEEFNNLNKYSYSRRKAILGRMLNPDTVPLAISSRTASIRLMAFILTAESIHRAAIIAPDGTIYEGISHYDAWSKAVEEQGDFTPLAEEEGFTTSDGRFVSREEAIEIARSHKQMLKERERVAPHTNKLMSEDLPHLREVG